MKIIFNIIEKLFKYIFIQNISVETVYIKDIEGEELKISIIYKKIPIYKNYDITPINIGEWVKIYDYRVLWQEKNIGAELYYNMSKFYINNYNSYRNYKILFKVINFILGLIYLIILFMIIMTGIYLFKLGYCNLK